MKKFVYPILLFLLINIVAGEELAYEGWLFNTKSFSFDNVNYDVLISSNGDLLLLKSDDSRSIVLGECTTTDYRKFCYNVSLFDIDIDDYKGYLYIYYLQPDITITRTVDTNLLEIGEKASFVTTIVNNGDINANDLVFTEDFPDTIEITSVRNAEIVNNSVYWKGDLNKNTSREIRYEVKSLGNVNQYLKASVEYYDGVKTVKEYSDEIRLYTDSILDITVTTDKDEYELNEDIDLSIVLYNSGDRDIDVNEFNILIPDSVMVEERTSSLDEATNGFIWSGEISNNTNKTFNFDLNGKKTGLSYVILNGDYEYRTQTNNIDNIKQSFVLSNQGISLNTSLDTTEYINAGQLLRIYLKVKNLNSFSKINNIALNTTSDIGFFENSNHSELGINESVFLLNTEIIASETESVKSYPIKFNVTYNTEDGEKYSSTLERTIVVRPIPKVKVIPTFSSTSVYEKDSITVTVKLDNPGDNDLKTVSLESYIPEIFTVKGPTSAYANINSSDSVEMLTFTLTPDLVNDETKYDVNFTVSYTDDDDNYTIINSNQVTVKPKKPDVTITKSLGDSTVYQGELVDVSYTITNNEDASVYDLRLITTQDQDFDTLNLFEHNIPKLDPGEKTTFTGEEIRPKVKGSHDIEASLLYYKDEYSRLFNETSNSPSVTVSEDTITGPVLMVYQNASESVYTGVRTLLELNLTNIGSDNIVLSNKEVIKTEKIMFEEFTYTNNGTYILPRLYYEYDYLDNTFRAFSNKITVKVINENSNNTIEETTIEEVTEPVEQTKEKIVTTEKETVETEKKPGFIKRFLNWLVKFFTWK